MFNVIIPKEDLAWLLGATITPAQLAAAKKEALKAKRPCKARTTYTAIWSVLIEDRPCLVAANNASMHVLDLSDLPLAQRVSFEPGACAPVVSIAKPAKDRTNAEVVFDHAPAGVEGINFARFLSDLHAFTRTGDRFNANREFLLSLAEAGVGPGRQAFLRVYQDHVFPGLRVRGQDLWGKDGLPSATGRMFYGDRTTYLLPSLLRAALDNPLMGEVVDVRVREGELDPVILAAGETTEGNPERLAIIMPTRIS